LLSKKVYRTRVCRETRIVMSESVGGDETESAAGKLAFVLGTRPEIIKLAPVIRECDAREIPYVIIHTGQHYSDELDTVFFEQLELPEPDYNLAVGSKSQGKQTGEMIEKLESVILEEDPAVVLVQGDTNSVLAGAIAVSKLDAKLGHVEAGLRSFNRDMPEEINRVLTDHAAEYLFAPTDTSRALLEDEGLPDERIFVTGNTIVDAVREHSELASQQSEILAELGVTPGAYALVTAHRAENVDDPDRFENLLAGVDRVATAFDLEAIYPIHPRARNRIAEFDLSVPETITLLDPQDYLDFLRLEQGAAIILTDSGGIQEEACILGVPCVTLREETERPETVEVGANRVAGLDPETILTSARDMLETDGEWVNPFGDGQAAEHIIDILRGETPSRDE
jgi:UDP-N-acetylglucosamine 2-epimerase (non-hydrolysing)